MPGYQVFGILGYPAKPWESTDALHCRAMGIADIGQLYIRHIPLTGNQPAQDNFILTADLFPCSDSAVYSDSVLIWYKVNNNAWQVTHMASTTGLHYTGMIPKQPAGSVISYYLYAADRSGHNATMPFMGPADPFMFTAVYTDITAEPDTLWFRTLQDCMFGKVTRLHNYSATGISLDSVESEGQIGWYVDSLSVNTYPHMMNVGDSEYIRVKFYIPLASSIPGYSLDTMDVVSELGLHRVIIVLNDSIFTGVQNTLGTEEALLGQNFPNPFTGSTTISYFLPERSKLRLEILNSFGQLVSVLTDAEIESGSSAVKFDAGDLPSGIYYYRLITEKATVTKKMLLYR
jgi:hypothetical protein